MATILSEYDLFNLMNIEKLRSIQEFSRQEKAQKKKDYYEGYFESYSTEILKNHFSDYEKILPEFEYYNLIKKIINRKSKVLKNGFQVKTDNTFLSNWITDNNTIEYFKNCEKYTNLLGMMAHRFYFENSELKFEMIPPSRFFVITDLDNSLKMRGFIWRRENYTEAKIKPVIYYAYDENNFYTLNDEFEVIKTEEHNYNFIPVGFSYSESPIDYFYNESDEDLRIAMENVAVWLTGLNHLQKYQSFSQPITKGMPKNAKIKTDPSTIINIPFIPEANDFGNFDFISPDTKLADVWNTLKEKISAIGNMYGISIGDIAKQNAGSKSGVALEWENAETKEEREDNREIWKNNIKGFLELAIKMLSRINPGVSTGLEFYIDFPEIEIISDPTKKNEIWLVQIAQDIKNKLDWIIEVNPDVKNYDEARKVLEENAKINANIIEGGANNNEQA